MKQDSRRVSRRNFIRVSSFVVLYPAIQSPFLSCAAFRPNEKVDWSKAENTSDRGGIMTVKEINGNAYLNGSILKPTAIIKSGQTVEVTSGFLHASLPDGSLIKLSQQASLTVDLDSERGGTLTLNKGALLSVIRKSKRKPYFIRNASALIGVKGTVVFTEVLTSGQKKTSTFPSNATDYFCNCNGSIDYLNPNKVFQKSSVSDYHEASFLIPKGNNIQFKRAGFLLNHSDDEIYNLIQTMEGKKHDTNWLFPKNTMPSY